MASWMCAGDITMDDGDGFCIQLYRTVPLRVGHGLYLVELLLSVIPWVNALCVAPSRPRPGRGRADSTVVVYPSLHATAYFVYVVLPPGAPRRSRRQPHPPARLTTFHVRASRAGSCALRHLVSALTVYLLSGRYGARPSETTGKRRHTTFPASHEHFALEEFRSYRRNSYRDVSHNLWERSCLLAGAVKCAGNSRKGIARTVALPRVRRPAATGKLHLTSYSVSVYLSKTRQQLVPPKPKEFDMTRWTSPSKRSVSTLRPSPSSTTLSILADSARKPFFTMRSE